MWYHRVYHTKKGISSIFLKKKKIVFANFCKHNILWFTCFGKTQNGNKVPLNRHYVTPSPQGEGFFGKPQNDINYCTEY